MNREEFIKKWVLFENGNMVKDLDELLSPPPAEGAAAVRSVCFQCKEEITFENNGMSINNGELYQCDDCHFNEYGYHISPILLVFQQHPTAEGAEEILRRVINETIGDPGPGEFHWHIHQEIALKAMEKYANESIKFYYEGLMSDFNILLKDFYLWVDKNYALGMLTDKYDDVIKEYLEDKGKGKTLKSTHN